MPRPWTVIDTLETPEGPLQLRQRDERDFLITIAGRVLMNSLANRSELALGELAGRCSAGHPRPRVVVGGLGMGFTLRAALDSLPAQAQVVVVELNPRVVEWCRGPLAHLTDRAVEDRRVAVVVADVADYLHQARPGTVDVILLDLYEGPHEATQSYDDPFYGRGALACSRRALSPRGVLAVWSEERDSAFQKRMTQAGFVTETLRPGHGGKRHAVYLGRVKS